MNIEQTKDELYRLKSDIRTGYPLRTTQQKENFMNSIDIAIQSLDMWDKVIEDIRYNYDDFITISDVEILTTSKDDVIKFLEKYKKEIEE